MNKITIKDVARVAGVSPATVSNALNNQASNISEERRAQVLKVVEELGYVPNFNAQNISGKNNKRIGFFIRDTESYHGDQVSKHYLHSINKYAYKNNIDIFNIIITSSNSDYADELKRRINKYNITDLIIYGADNDTEVIKVLNEFEINKIFIEIPVTSNDTSHFVSVDNYNAQLDLTNLVIDTYKPKNILYLTGDPNAYVSEERLRGFNDSVKHHKLKHSVLEANYSTSKTYELIKHLKIDDFDIIMTGSDDIAIGVITYFKEQNINKLVCGFDNRETSQYLNYPLITVDQDVDELCRALINMFITNEFENMLFDYTIISYNTDKLQ